MDARFDSGADMALGGVLAKEGTTDADSTNQDGVIADYRLRRHAAKKAPPDAHRPRIEITDVQHFLVEPVQQHKGAAVWS